MQRQFKEQKHVNNVIFLVWNNIVYVSINWNENWYEYHHLYHNYPFCQSTQLIIYSLFIFSIFFMKRVQNILVEIDNYLSKCLEMNDYVNSKCWQWNWLSKWTHTFLITNVQYDNEILKILIYFLCSLKRTFESLRWTQRDQRKQLRVW